MKPYFAYIRVSTVKQGERGSSLAEQRSAIETYAANHGLTIATWFQEMETAATRGRREFTKLMTALRAGKARGLIIHKIDRSARNLRDWADLGELIDRGVDIRFVTDNFDLLSRGGRLSADIQAVIAADYVRNLREEVKKGLYGRLKQGLYPWGAPLGYHNNGGGMPKTVDPIAGPLVRQLFERYASGVVSIDDLRFEFAARGLTAKSGRAMHPSVVSDILNNPFYIGVMRVKPTKETFAGIHEPLISKALFERVQAVLRGKAAPKAKKSRFLFRQMIHCASCGNRTLTGERHGSFAYYRCHGCRPSVSWPIDRVEAAVFAAINQARVGDVGDDGDEIRILKSYLAQEIGDREAAVAKAKEGLKLRRAYIDDRIGKLADLIMDDVIDRAEYAKRKEQLLFERQGIEERLRGLSGSVPLEMAFETFELRNTKLLQYETLTDDEKRELVDIVHSKFTARGNELEFRLCSPFHEIGKVQVAMRCGHFPYDLRIRKIAKILMEYITSQTHEPHDSNVVPVVPTSPPLSRPDAWAA